MEKKNDGRKPFERMRDLARRIVSVPKAEFDVKARKHHRKKRRAPKPD
jgi:hypothetical protein